MLKQFRIITVVIAVLLVPTMIFAADSVGPKETSVNPDNTVTVPIEINNQDGLMAIDIPLKFSEGVTLDRVEFKDTRVEYFDLKIANIDNDANTVIIGLVTQISAESKPTLPVGQGAVANLIFTVDDPSVSEVTLESVVLEKPHHEMTFIYTHERSSSDDDGQTRTAPQFNTVSLSLSGGGEALPVSFGLDQNYPNPFNPTTDISFSLPTPANVSLRVYNLLGQEVATVVNGDLSAGVHTVTWDGSNDGGAQVSSGIYFYRLVAGDEIATRKMMLLK